MKKENTVSLFPLCLKFMWVCTYIYVSVCFSAISGGRDLVSSSITVDLFLWSRVSLCTWRLLAAYLSWSCRDVHDARLITWVLGWELWSSWFTASFLALAIDVFKEVCMGWRHEHVCVPAGVLAVPVLREARAQLPLSSSLAFCATFWDRISLKPEVGFHVTAACPASRGPLGSKLSPSY